MIKRVQMRQREPMTAMKYSGTYNDKESTDEAERANDCDEVLWYLQ